MGQNCTVLLLVVGPAEEAADYTAVDVQDGVTVLLTFAITARKRKYRKYQAVVL